MYIPTKKNNKGKNMNEEEYLEDLDEEDEKRILVDYDLEKIEPRFRWEYAHESSTEIGSVFRNNWPDR